jgi:transcriptional regulator with XRE-family HTH domain
VIVRRSLGRRLKALRAAAGKTAADVTTAGIASRAKLFKIEAGSVPVRMADVRALCWLYGADDATTDTLADLALNTASEGWWEDYGDVMPSWFALYVELESAATRLLTYGAELVPGLLQTADYHRAVFSAQLDITSDSAERQIALRIARQRAAFERDRPLQVRAVLSAAALDREVGGSAVMSTQRAHLLASRADIRFLPADVGAHAAMNGPFSILEFQGDPAIVYLETLAGGRYVEKLAIVTVYQRVFEAIAEQAEPIEEYA